MENPVLYPAENDPELQEWLKHQVETGSGFVRSLAELATAANIHEFQVLRPALVTLRSHSPEPGSSMRTLLTDDYRVTYNDADAASGLEGVFASFNHAAFGNSLAHTEIRFATSIQNLKAPSAPVGLLALPEDEVSHPIPNQFRIQVPHIFITERLSGMKPVDEWVLLHEMCHFNVRHHGAEFVEELKRTLDIIHWRVLLGGY
jgi:hypothetical protein